MTTLATPQVIVVGPPQAPKAGDPCAYCCGPLPEAYVPYSGVGYCDERCLDLGLHACPDCGEDRRLPADPALGPAMCRNHRRGRGAA